MSSPKSLQSSQNSVLSSSKEYISSETAYGPLRKCIPSSQNSLGVQYTFLRGQYVLNSFALEVAYINQLLYKTYNHPLFSKSYQQRTNLAGSCPCIINPPSRHSPPLLLTGCHRRTDSSSCGGPPRPPARAPAAGPCLAGSWPRPHLLHSRRRTWATSLSSYIDGLTY